MGRMAQIDPKSVPPHALAVLRALERSGHEAWVVGGWVRDALRGAPAHDVDVCTSAPVAQSEAALAAAGIEYHETGVAHGTVTAVVDGRPVETTTYRVDGTYSDQRHPDSVTFVRDIREDLARRDFTINAMAWHPDRGLLDPFGGERDLAEGVVRAVGEPPRRFGEDALRVLRAVRFASRLGFAVEPATQAALDACAGELAHVARERVGSELRGIVASGRGGWALLHEAGAMAAALPALGRMRGFAQRSPYHCYDVLEHTARVMDGIEVFSGGVATERLRWAGLLHDIGKPACLTLDGRGQGHFFGHPREGAVMAERIGRDLALPLGLLRGVVALVRLHDRPTRPTVPSMLALVAELDRRSGSRTREDTLALAHEMLVLRRADAWAKASQCRGYATVLDAHERVLRRIEAEGLCWRTSELAVGGGEVMAALGISPGPAVGEALGRLLALVMDGSVPNERAALLEALASGALLAGRGGHPVEVVG